MELNVQQLQNLLNLLIKTKEVTPATRVIVPSDEECNDYHTLAGWDTAVPEKVVNDKRCKDGFRMVAVKGAPKDLILHVNHGTAKGWEY